MILESKNLIIRRDGGQIDKALFSRMQSIKNKILSENYNLSLNFVSPLKALDLNKKYRNKDYIPNILSFPLSKSEGEIFICLSIVRKEANKFNLSYKNFLSLILIHGCLHLKGLDHGEKMDRLEQKYLDLFMIK